MKNKEYLLSVIILLTFSIACTSPNSMNQIKTGDILFRGNTQQGLSDAINKVTQTQKNTNYSHMGICYVSADTIWIFHAAPEKGVCKEEINLFLSPNNEAKYTTDLYRLKPDLAQSAIKASHKAKKYIGLPYNYSYIIEDTGMYCSEYIYELFKEDSVFTLDPMTFKDAHSNTFNKTWIQHYQNLGIEIPEGELGCNPNGMAASENLIYITNIQ
ncbi:YiiX/YebB-like N1pC/P60 family cysteine hydrolase [Saccharicrinis aurantiacus]|uniref:YiiX/YebB-like N1pC/P60 family cysteine hydrolase n=1 Tax=Saccharicrinis aurantiacus TaxID=1849719 RepID=UPI002491E454|nr:YiiX/YebB-like N1pC/P60 family cysteine hydrolase [Saccharicrinis aurantiacus]